MSSKEMLCQKEKLGAPWLNDASTECSFYSVNFSVVKLKTQDQLFLTFVCILLSKQYHKIVFWQDR